ncbi:MAG TPA: hypothetical protein VLA48_02690 [Nitrososphaeraceae archaeon]|nr:hypothetical protein [Nitrososphaeraceae archaeon]
MKKVKVKYIHTGDIDEGILFESLDDVKYIKEALKKAENGVITKFAKSGESAERLDHIIGGFKPLEKAIASLSCLTKLTHDINPIYSLGNSSGIYLKSLTSQLMQGREVFQNKNGGLCPVEFSLEVLEVLEDNLSKIEDDPTYSIRENSKVINLENDWYLESKALDYMNKRFGNYTYSYIKDLKTTSEASYKYIFKKFKEQGGEYIYVYTTGIDVEQMYEYSFHALDANLTKFIFDFNRGLDKNIQKFIDWLSERAEVEVISAKKE